MLVDFKNQRETQSFARGIASGLGNGDTLLLLGDVGAGKSTFARAVIQEMLAQENRTEDVPSPTFTLVQTYEFETRTVWHTDLYRMTHLDEVTELGLDEAFENAVCLIEWADRLGELTPQGALKLTFSTLSEEQRRLSLEWSDSKWDTVLETCLYKQKDNS